MPAFGPAFGGKITISAPIYPRTLARGRRHAALNLVLPPCCGKTHLSPPPPQVASRASWTHSPLSSLFQFSGENS